MFTVLLLAQSSEELLCSFPDSFPVLGWGLADEVAAGSQLVDFLSPQDKDGFSGSKPRLETSMDLESPTKHPWDCN